LFMAFEGDTSRTVSSPSSLDFIAPEEYSDKNCGSPE